MSSRRHVFPHFHHLLFYRGCFTTIKKTTWKNLAISGWNWASMHISIFQWIGLRDKYRQNLNRISCFTMFYTPKIHRGFLHPAHTGYPKNQQNAWPPDENNHALWWKHRQGRVATIHITPELFHGGYFSMIVVGNSWCLKDLQYRSVSHEKYPCPISSDWFVDRYSVSIG